jgi:glycosyltransferase A (GT-A) superfamily protein (DUF2064 family)
MRQALRPHLTAAQSKALYRRFLSDTLETTRDIENMDVYLSYSPRGSRSDLQNLAPSGVKLICQEGEKLGDRLAGLAGRMMRSGYERVLLFCALHPDLPTCLLHQAAEALEKDSVDMVLGPNERGRFYLVGMKEPHPSLFPDIDWEGDEIDTSIASWAKMRRVRLKTLPAWYDVRDLADLRRHLAYYRLRQRSRKGALSATGEYLDRIESRIEDVREFAPLS